MPGPLGGDTNRPLVDPGTLARVRTQSPGGRNVGLLSTQDRIAEAMRRALPMLPGEARGQVSAMLTPESLVIVSGTLLLWAGSHLFGVGEIVDVILLAVGFALVGTGVFSGASELYSFATCAVNARGDADLDEAARHFATAVTTLGITAVSVVLLRRSARDVAARGRPGFRPMQDVGPAPPGGVKPTITRPHTLNGALGETDAWGNIAISRTYASGKPVPLSEQQLTLYHEWVHSVLSPKIAPLRRLRASVNMTAYVRSALLQYIEEALAESYAQLKVAGIRKLIVGIRFPLAEGYVTVSQLGSEGVAIGNIVVEGMQLRVWLASGDWQSGLK